MTNENIEPRLIRADDLIAESLEERASRMPQGPDRDYTLRMATLFRTSNRTGMLRIWEVPPKV
jgi:hypothetical protein